MTEYRHSEGLTYRGMPVELSFEGLRWDLANGVVRVPCRGGDEEIVSLLQRVHQIVGELRSRPDAHYLQFAIDGGVVVVTGVTPANESVAKAVLMTAAAAR